MSLKETKVDEHYMIVRARFVWRFEKPAAPIDVDIDSTFILYIKDDVFEPLPSLGERGENGGLLGNPCAMRAGKHE